jgi:hypothetical protein
MRKGHRSPHLWKSGPDPVDHQLHLECQRRRAQARFRGQTWLITEEEYIQLWREEHRWLNKGRSPENICMCIIDPNLPWTVDNVEFMLRRQHYQTSRRHEHA